MIESQDHCTVVLDMAGELGGGLARFVEVIRGGVVVGAGVWIVKSDRVRRGTPPNRNTCHGLGLRFREVDSAVYLVVCPG